MTGAEAEMYATALGTNHIDVTTHGAADGTPNNWAATHTFKTVNDLQREVVTARVRAGLHYRGSALEGLEIARDVARWTLRRYFRPTPWRHRARGWMRNPGAESVSAKRAPANLAPCPSDARSPTRARAPASSGRGD